MTQTSLDQDANSSNVDQSGHFAPCPKDLLALEELLGQLETAVGVSTRVPCVIDPATDQYLAERRLGSAAGLFVALRSKHAATATHGLHVAFLCSAWARKLDLAVEERDEIEVASLLHDVGIIGVPDRILQKPARLESQEIGVLAHARRLSQEILRANGAAANVIAIVKNVPVWYNAPTQEGEPSGPKAPLGARMIAIAEAFDSITTDHVFRPARSKERALDELVRCAGTQFDPVLVDKFAEIGKQDLSQLYRQLAGQWLRDLEHGAPKIFEDDRCVSRRPSQTDVSVRFQDKVLDNMRDSVIMVDPALNVIGWNRAAEQLTGITAERVVERPWLPEIIEMRDDQGRLVLAHRCPLRDVVATGMQSAGRFSLTQRNGVRVNTETQIMPVLDRDCSLLGVAMLMRDVSSEHSMKRLCDDLRSKATVDPLTKVSNRGEFARVLAELTQEHRKHGTVFSVIICDLDHFKQVNDTHGHQAGDEVLVKTAAVLQEACPSNDLVARYGGEEFVVLCPDCEISATTRRAERIRDLIGRTEHATLGRRRTTASFGVTQVQAGDTAETIVRRADRALYLAKDQGRNRVIQLGAGTSEEEPVRRWSLWRRRKTSSPEVLAEEDMVAPGPVTFALEKLRGFVADHQAVIKRTEENILEFELLAPVYNARRKTDLQHVFIMALRFSEEHSAKPTPASSPASKVSQIRIAVVVSLEKAPARGSSGLTDYARQVIAGLRAYLMARTVPTLREDGECQRGEKILLPTWRAP